MKIDLVCQLNFDHKIWGAVSDLFFTSQISFADSSNSQSVMPEYIRPRNIQSPDREDRH